MAIHALGMWWFSSNPFSTWHSKEAGGQTTLQPLYPPKDPLPISQEAGCASELV